jgi:hypothetical protein
MRYRDTITRNIHIIRITDKDIITRSIHIIRITDKDIITRSIHSIRITDKDITDNKMKQTKGTAEIYVPFRVEVILS